MSRDLGEDSKKTVLSVRGPRSANGHSVQGMGSESGRLPSHMSKSAFGQKFEISGQEHDALKSVVTYSPDSDRPKVTATACENDQTIRTTPDNHRDFPESQAADGNLPVQPAGELARRITVPNIQIDYFDEDDEDENENTPVSEPPAVSVEERKRHRKNGVYRRRPSSDDEQADDRVTRSDIARDADFSGRVDEDSDDGDIKNSARKMPRDKTDRRLPSDKDDKERIPRIVASHDERIALDSDTETKNPARKRKPAKDYAVALGENRADDKDVDTDSSSIPERTNSRSVGSKFSVPPAHEKKRDAKKAGRKINFEVSEDDEEGTDTAVPSGPNSLKVDFAESKFSGHHAYEKKPMVSAMKGGRKTSQEAMPHHRRVSVAGAGRRISVYQRRMSVMPDASSAGSCLGVNMLPTRKGSMVMLDQIPQIIQESLMNYLDQASDPANALPENDEEDDDVMRYRPSKLPRMSIFSTWSCGSNESDSTFCDPEESLPKLDHYGYVQAIPDMNGYQARPTLYQLREEQGTPLGSPTDLGHDLEDGDPEEGQTPEQKQTEAPASQKMGWIQGVLVRCLLNIFGVMLFLRLTWMTGQAGIGLASLIILISSLVTTLTTMSMAAICTNGEVKGGGAYYMISRSLGPEFGGAIGVIFSLANAVAAAMHVVGFAETLRDLLYKHDVGITGDLLHDVRVIAGGTMVLLLIVVLIGLDFESKAQLVLLVILVASLVNYFVGTFIPPSEDKRRVGFVGYHGLVFVQNIGPDFREADGTDYDFFKIFAIYFPSATGILAGANISGDLKNPSKAIPRGTFLAILITTVVYLAIVWTCGSCLLRDAVGPAVAMANNTSLPLTLEEIQTCSNLSCSFGLQNSHAIMGVASAYPPLIYAGAFSATLSSGLACLVSAPKVFQALAKDKLFPFIGIFGRGYGKNGEPRPGYILTFFICVGMTCIGSLDIIAPIISNFFLMAYALINFSCFDAAFANSPGFRPSFHFFNKWLSLLGALICLVIMFLLKWWAALATVIMVTGLYVFLVRRQPDVNWGSSAQAHAYNDALKSTLSLVNVNEHVKNFRPQILALTGYPRNRPALVDFASCITKRQSLLVCAHVFVGDMQRHLRHLRSTAAYRWFRNRDVRAFYTSLAAPSVRHGAQVLLQSQGLGKLRPNTLLLGFKNNWQTAEPMSVHNYVGIIHDAFDLHYGVGILRVPGGLDAHKVSDFLLDATDDTLEDMDEDNVSMEEGVDASEEDDAEEKNNDVKATPSGKSGDLPAPVGNDVSLKTFKKTKVQEHLNNGFSQDELRDNYSDESGDDDRRGPQNDDASDGDSSKKKKKKKGDDKSHEERKDADGLASVAQTEARRHSQALHSALTKCEGAADAPSFNTFRGKQQGTIDAWWLFDDGGLGLLVPYLLSTRKQWRHCKLRVFCAGTKKSNLEEDQRRMAALLSKFRIDCSDITIIPDLRTKPKKSSYKEFEEMIYQWRFKGGELSDDYPWKVSDADLASHKEKIYMQIRIREKLLELSKDASLIVVTLPVPRKICPAGLYMSWLDTLTRDLPPTLLLRGNQQNVLTYSS